jgi:hypothetical protein
MNNPKGVPRRVNPLTTLTRGTGVKLREARRVVATMPAGRLVARTRCSQTFQKDQRLRMNAPPDKLHRQGSFKYQWQTEKGLLLTRGRRKPNFRSHGVS